MHRQLSSRALLYTEMVTAPALVRGNARHLLDFSDAEHPMALQLGGSEPKELAQAAKMAADEGYREVNLNVGCPSDRVQSGCFGAILMERPALVADCVASMIAAQPLPVTVKCRIGVDDQTPEEVLPEFLAHIVAAGCERVTIHARKAWLKGLSPKENREVPPLNYPLVHQMKAYFPSLHMSINGGITSLDQAQAFLEGGLDGVMIGRAAYHTPVDVLAAADRVIFGRDVAVRDPFEVVAAMWPYISDHLQAGGRLHQVTRHMLGLFAARPGARNWRRILSQHGHGSTAGLDVLDAALNAVRPIAA